MEYDFDEIVERAGTCSTKWDRYGPDALPMWVADMDFRAPQPVIDALAERVRHGVFGYEHPSLQLSLVISERMQRLYGWTVEPEAIVYLPGVVAGLNVACRAFGENGTGVLVQTPVYPPFLAAPASNGQLLQAAPLQLIRTDGQVRYEIDWRVFEDAITPTTRLFILCHPHNPTGVSYPRHDLRRMAEICAEREVLICSDEIHCDLLLGGARHTPMASLSSEIAARCVTLMAPSKTFNVPGLGCSFAVVQDARLRERFVRAARGIVPHVNEMGLTAALAAYEQGGEWLQGLLAYLTANRDSLLSFAAERLRGLAVTRPDATYLAWLDCRGAGIPSNPHRFFLERAGVALNDGAAFGPDGEGFVRLNFGTQRSRLDEGLRRIHAALTSLDCGSAK